MKKKQMTSLLLAGMAAVFVPSCSVIDEDTSDCAQDSTKTSVMAETEWPVSFDIASMGGDDGATTRYAPGTIKDDASDGVSKAIGDVGFGVFAAHTGQHKYDVSTIVPDFMYNEKVTLSGGSWVYSPMKYWPVQEAGKNADYISFFAYAPHAGNPGGASYPNYCITDFSLPYEQGVPWLTYHIAESPLDPAKPQVDLLYTMVNDQQRMAKNAKVKFTFRHALSRINNSLTVSLVNGYNNATDYDQMDVRWLYKQMQALKNYDSSWETFIALTGITLELHCTEQARLVLSQTMTPLWQPIYTGTTFGTRTFKTNLDPGATEYSSTNYSAVMIVPNGNNKTTRTSYTESSSAFFVIPLTVNEQTQWVKVTGEFQLVVHKSGETDGYRSKFYCTLNDNFELTGLTAGSTKNISGCTDKYEYSTDDGNPVMLKIHASGSYGAFDIPDQYYTGSEIKPDVLVYGSDGQLISNTSGYTVTKVYENNINSKDADPADPLSPKVTITVAKDGADVATITKYFSIKSY